MTNAPRMRTRDKAILQLRIDDPETSLTRFAIDRLISSGKLSTVKIGNKVLINYDLLLDIVANGFEDTEEPQQIGVIRPIKI